MVNADHVIDFFLEHRVFGIALVAVWAFVTFCMVTRLWVLHRRERVLTKLVWSLILLVPLFGWLFFTGRRREALLVFVMLAAASGGSAPSR